MKIAFLYFYVIFAPFDDKNRRQFSAVCKMKMRILDNRTTLDSCTIFNFPMGSPINRLRLLYILTQQSRRISDLTSPSDSISKQFKDCFRKVIREKNAAVKKCVAYYRSIYFYSTRVLRAVALRVLRPFLQKKVLIVVYQALIRSFVEHINQTQNQNDVIRR